jgi:hypothetical protein
MKTGRNDPCPCGSGKKYKKCCLAKDHEETAKREAARAVRSAAGGQSQSLVESPAAPPPPRDPAAERAAARWQEFEALPPEGRVTLFLETARAPERMTHDMAFEMLSRLRADGLALSEPARFAECLHAVAQQQPDAFAANAPYFLSWQIEDALAQGERDRVPVLAHELGVVAARNLDLDVHFISPSPMPWVGVCRGGENKGIARSGADAG